jgi:hypothetical protein
MGCIFRVLTSYSAPQVNHGCFEAAKLELIYEDLADDSATRRIALVAKRFIEKGEFLAWDYDIKFEHCRCKSDEHREQTEGLVRRIIQ